MLGSGAYILIVELLMYNLYLHVNNTNCTFCVYTEGISQENGLMKQESLALTALPTYHFVSTTYAVSI